MFPFSLFYKVFVFALCVIFVKLELDTVNAINFNVFLMSMIWISFCRFLALVIAINSLFFISYNIDYVMLKLKQVKF